MGRRNLIRRPLRRCIIGVILLAGVLGMTGCGGGSSRPASDVGSWGGQKTTTPSTPATLTVTATGGNLQLPCNQTVQFSQPIQPDASGAFSVTGAASVPLTDQTQPATLAGTVSGNVMTLTITVSGQATVYTLTYGQQAPPFTEICPQ